MRNSQLAAIASIATLFIACTPLVRTQTRPHGPNISADCFKDGETTLVSLSIERKDGTPSWKSEFVEESPENVTTEDIPNLTIIKRKLDQDRTKGSSIKPYKLNIRSDDKTYETTVSFRTNS
jgi:hypothetical protein